MLVALLLAACGTRLPDEAFVTADQGATPGVTTPDGTDGTAEGVAPLLRAQTLVVVVVATCAEVVGSLIWGVYTYRLENLPSFVRGRVLGPIRPHLGNYPRLILMTRPDASSSVPKKGPERDDAPDTTAAAASRQMNGMSGMR